MLKCELRNSRTVWCTTPESGNSPGYYDVRTAGDSVNEYPIFYITRTLICPVDYDGAVFKFGYTSPELSEQSGKIDFEARVYKVDELPYNGDDYLYFTLTDD